MYDNIRELAFFLRVSEESSFSAAARSLDLDPSTISKVVQRLENRLGVRLFHRTSRVLRLTQEGERFLSAAQKVMQALEEAEGSLGPAMTEASGLLRVSSTPAGPTSRRPGSTSSVNPESRTTGITAEA